MKKLLILLAVGTTVLIYSCTKNDSLERVTNTADRQKAIDDYNNNYLPSSVSNAELAWTGNTSGCNAGTISDLSQTRLLQRLNYFRRQVGYTENITLDTTKSSMCQDAALMMKANNSLSHSPPTSWSCYTANGASAAGSSNLSLGYHSTAALTGQMQDAGSNNGVAGHRRWILYSGLKTVGHGSTDYSSALYVIHNFGNPPAQSTPEFIAWPAKGYVIDALVFPRWTFGIPGADLSNASITMTGPSGAITLTQETYATGYGDNTVVWVPQLPATIPSDTKYTVTVSNVKISGVAKMYTYDVTVITP